MTHTNVIDLDERRRNRPPPAPPAPDLGERLVRIKANLEKINRLMAEIKKREDEHG